jgi:hypothetical protein
VQWSGVGIESIDEKSAVEAMTLIDSDTDVGWLSRKYFPFEAES